MPWQLLNIDPDTATTKEVKRSYARLVKTTRPDQDPEGFTILHDAYQKALYLVSMREDSQDTNESLLHDSPLNQTEIHKAADVKRNHQSAPSRVAPPAMIQAFDELTAALDSEDEGVEPYVRKVEECLLQNPDYAECWGNWIAELIERFHDHAELRFKLNVLLFEAENQSIHACLAVIHRLEKQSHKAAIIDVSQFFLRNKDHIATEVGGYLFQRLGLSCALWKPDLATKMSIEAFQFLPVGVREHASQEIDAALHVSRHIREVPDEQKRFWFFRLLYPNANHDWSTEESNEAIKSLLSRRAKIWSCYNTLVELVPKETFQELARSQLTNQSETTTYRKSGSGDIEDIFQDELGSSLSENDTVPATKKREPISNRAPSPSITSTNRPKTIATTKSTVSTAPTRQQSYRTYDNTPDWDKPTSEVATDRQTVRTETRSRHYGRTNWILPTFLILTALKIVMYVLATIARNL